MSIIVVCPGCKKSFKVSDKFAGQAGACPKCKGTIHVPDKKGQVQVHGPAVSMGDKSVKPILREEAKIPTPVVLVAVGAASLGVLLIAWVAGGVFQNILPARAIGLLLVSPPLVVAAYSFMRNDELEPYRGTALWVRAFLCSLGYVILWGVFGYLSSTMLSGELWEWLFVAPPLLAVGGVISFACLDLDYGNGFFHYAFYVLVTCVLRWVAGMGWVWEISNTPGL